MVKVVISGAGPAGLLLAQHLVSRPGYQVHIVEQRPDPLQLQDRRQDRTFPVGLMPRGMSAIREIPGLEDSLQGFGKWIDRVSFYRGTRERARSLSRPPSFSIERNDLVRAMAEQLQKQPKSSSLTFHYECGIETVHLHNQTVGTTKGFSESFDHVVAADGARSVVRTALAQDPSNELEFNLTQVPDLYKSLFLELEQQDTDETDGEEGEKLSLQPNSMYGWMAGSHRIITVPVNPDYSSGVYIFPPQDDPFESMESSAQLLEYLQSKSPVLSKLVTEEEAEAFLQRPSASTWTVECNRLTIGSSKAVLLGGAAHAVSASIGQGCNSALEDVLILNRLLVENGDDWSKALPLYNQVRLPDAHAVKELSDYTTPRSKRMQVEYFARLVLRKVLPKGLANRFLKPLPPDVIYDASLSYQEMLNQCRWWTDRVKWSMETGR